MTVPARWIRRCVSPIAFVLISAASLAVLVATVVPLALVSVVWSPARKALRLVVFALVILGAELKALVAAFGLWLMRSGTEAHYRSLGRALHVLVRTASKLFALEPDHEVRNWPTDRLRRSNHALLVLCRHAGPGDSLILLDALINRYGLRPRLVMKSSMQLDPVVDVYFNRLPAAFVDPADTDGSAQRSIRRLAHDLGSDDTLVMFPEGGNYTPRRHRRAIRHLAKAGRHGDAARANRLRNVMPPQPGGVLAVLDEVEEVDVLVLGHAGIGRIHSICDVWRSLEDRKLVALKAWFTPSEEVPTDSTRRIGWLFDIWTTVDQWVETADVDDRRQHRPAAKSEQDDDCPTSGSAI